MQGARATISKDGPRDSANRPAGRSGLGKSADTSPKASARPLPGTAICMALVALAMILGGGGTSNPQAEMILQLLTAILMILLLALPNLQHGLGPVPRPVWILGIMVLLVPVCQLIPLPPAVWQTLPGREVEVDALSVALADGRWMPLSMAPARTFASFLAMASAVLVLLQVSRLPLRDRNWVCAVIVAVAVLSMLLGVLQLSQTGGWYWSLYSEFSKGHLIGFQANHNAQADILQIALLAFGVLMVSRLGDGRRHGATLTVLTLGILAFIVSVFMTGSRAGISLTLVSLTVLGAMLWPFARKQPNLVAWLAGLMVGLVGLTAAVWQFASVRKVVDRFSILHDARADLWADTSYAIQQVWPFGSGVGTIVPMLEAAERLEVVDPSRPVRAHNDWLEWTLEGGVPGLIVLAAVLTLVAFLLVRALMATRGRSGEIARHAQSIFSGGVLVLLGLHSVVDYPLRGMSLAVLAAVAVAFLTDPPTAKRRDR